jgi:processive 1,2-diacylglycerol beta-glucosyltransferase
VKVLIVYASAGVGHKKAAEAVYKAYSAHDKAQGIHDEIVYLDLLDKCTALTKAAYPGLYIFTVKHAVWIWALLFKMTDNRTFSKLTKKLKMFIEASGCPEFLKYLKKEKFDVIISTHFYSSAMAGELKRKGQINSKLITVVTDYRVHAYWLTRETDKFLVAASQTKADLIKDGIDEDKIEITGIPVDLKFALKHDKKAIEDKMQFSDKELRILIMGGGFGVGPFEYLLENLVVFKKELNLVFVCGYNQDLLDRLKALSEKLGFKVALLGYAENIDELMQISDLIITKAGGITLSESLVSGLPAIVIRPIPGQEEGNAGYLVQQGAVVTKETPEAIVEFLKQVLKNRDILTKMKQSALKAAHPQAAAKVVKIAQEIISQ